MRRLRLSFPNADHAYPYSLYQSFFAVTECAPGSHDFAFCVATSFHRFENYA